MSPKRIAEIRAVLSAALDKAKPLGTVEAARAVVVRVLTAEIPSGRFVVRRLFLDLDGGRVAVEVDFEYPPPPEEPAPEPTPEAPVVRRRRPRRPPIPPDTA